MQQAINFPKLFFQYVVHIAVVFRDGAAEMQGVDGGLWVAGIFNVIVNRFQLANGFSY